MPRGSKKWVETTVRELLADPIVWLVMEADGVSRVQLEVLLKTVAGKVGERSSMANRDHNAPAGGLDPGGGLYRPGVGIMLLNARNEVFVGRRLDREEPAWQMPQGGIDDGEEPAAAAVRELEEEIGTSNAEILAISKDWLQYTWPATVNVKGKLQRFMGQRLRWFVMRFKGLDSEINVATPHPEFSAWKWVSMDSLPELIVDFKRQLYQDLLGEFADARARWP